MLNGWHWHRMSAARYAGFDMFSELSVCVRLLYRILMYFIYVAMLMRIVNFNLCISM